jgi:O-antigen ligase
LKPTIFLSSSKSALDALVFFLLLALLIFAPLIKGGNRPLPLLVLELMALPLLAYLVWRPSFLKHLPRSFLLALGLLVLFPLLQWLPLPAALWQELPGREAYAVALADFGSGPSAVMRASSVVPGATEAAWLAMLPALAVLLATVGLREESLKCVVYVFLAVAAFQAVLALIQFGGGSQTAFRLNPNDVGMAVGTYANRNHLAGLLEMALPIALGLLAARIGRGGGEARYAGRNWLRRIGQFLVRLPRPNQTMLFAALVIVLMLGIIFSRSRSGIVMGMAGIFLSALLYGRHIGGTRSNSLATLFAVIGLALAAIIGLAPVLDRFSADDALADARWAMYATSMTALWEFFPFGSGLGTFPEVYWRFQPDSIAQFVNHAHNDYIEFVLEGGLPALAVIAMFLVLYALRWPSLLRGASWGTLSFMQVGAGIGLLLMALHSLTDFNLHIPANAIYFALLAAVFFHRSERANHHHNATRPVKPEPAAEFPTLPAARLPVVRPRGRNPFAQ